MRRYLLPLLLLSAAAPAADAADAAPAATAPADAAPAATTGVPAATDTAWLLRQWQLAFDPDNSPKDFLTFSDGGTVALKTADGRDMAGRWVIEGERLTLSFDVNGRTLDMPMSIAPDRTSLTNDSGARYEPVP